MIRITNDRSQSLDGLLGVLGYTSESVAIDAVEAIVDRWYKRCKVGL